MLCDRKWDYRYLDPKSIQTFDIPEANDKISVRNEEMDREKKSNKYSVFVVIQILSEKMLFETCLKSLITLQKTYELGIPSVNHSVIISFFESKLPKFSTDAIDPRVSIIEDYVFNKVNSWDHNKNPSCGFGQLLQD